MPTLVDVTALPDVVGYGLKVTLATTTGGGQMVSSYTPDSLIYAAQSGPGGYLNRISLAIGSTPTPHP